MTFLIALVLFIVVMGYLDSRLGWPKPNDRSQRYVSIAERSKTLKRP
jgi:hypothetical protein